MPMRAQIVMKNGNTWFVSKGQRDIDVSFHKEGGVEYTKSSNQNFRLIKVGDPSYEPGERGGPNASCSMYTLNAGTKD